MRLLCLSLAGLGLLTGSVQAANIASDNAGNAAYSDGWQDGDNGGTGFGAWSFASSSGNNYHFLQSSTQNADGSLGIDSANGKAWGMASNGGGLANAVRPLTGGALSVGQTFGIDFDNGWIDTGNSVGVALQNASGENVFEFLFMGGASTYTVNAGTAVGTLPGFTGDGLHLDFLLGPVGAYTATVTLDPTKTPQVYAVTGTVASPSGGSAITQVRIFNANAGSGAQRDSYVNNLSVVPEPASLGLIGLGALAMLRRRARRD